MQLKWNQTQQVLSKIPKAAVQRGMLHVAGLRRGSITMCVTINQSLENTMQNASSHSIINFTESWYQRMRKSRWTHTTIYSTPSLFLLPYPFFQTLWRNYFLHRGGRLMTTVQIIMPLLGVMNAGYEDFSRAMSRKDQTRQQIQS